MSNQFSYRIEQLLDTVPETKKLELDYLKGNVDQAIADLVYYKEQTYTAYDSYYGRRDYKEYQHLADNYGVGSPVDIPKMRLMGSRIDYLVGKSMQNKFDYYVTCTNTEAIDLKNNEKRVKILNKLQDRLKLHNQQIKSLLDKDKEGKTAPVFTDGFLKEIKEEFGEGWQASFEIAAQDALVRLVRELSLMEKSKDHFKDALISGGEYNRIFVEEIGRDPAYWVCDPRNLFYEPNPSSPWIKDCRRVVYRQFVHPTQVLNKYGHLMSKDDREKVARAISGYYNSSNAREHVHFENRRGEEVALSSYPYYHNDLLEVYHVEWVATNLVDGTTDTVDHVESKGFKNIKTKGKRLRMDRYEGYKIEQLGSVYFGLGKSRYIERSNTDPNKCTLTYNGRLIKDPRIETRYYEDRTDLSVEPFSFVTATKDISDLYDITYMQLNQLLASVRPGGTYEVMEHIPNWMGKTPEERLMKSAGYEKAWSKKIVSLSQEGTMPGEPGSIPFNNYGSYPSNVEGSLIQAYLEYLNILEQQADRMLGLNPRMRGEMEQRDGKATTMNAIQQGDLFTKELFRMHSSFMEDSLTRLLNATRICYQDGFVGSIVIGKREKQFLIDPLTHSIADYNVYVSDDIEEKEQQQKADELITLAIQNQVADLKLAFDTLSSRSISQKKQAVNEAYKRKEESAEQQLMQLQQQLEELQKQHEKLQKDYDRASQKADEVKMRELEIKERDVNSEIEERKAEVEMERQKIKDKKEVDKMKIQAEIAQLSDNNKNNDEINWNR